MDSVLSRAAPSSVAPLDPSATAPVGAPFLSSLSSLDSFKRLCYGPTAPLFDTLSAGSGIDRLSSLSSFSLQALSAAAASSIEGEGSAGSGGTATVAALANQKSQTSPGVSHALPRTVAVSPASTAAAASDFGAGGTEQLKATERKQVEVTAAQGGALASCAGEATAGAVVSVMCRDTVAKDSSLNLGAGGDERSTVSTLSATPCLTVALGSLSPGGTGACASSTTTGGTAADTAPCAAESSATAGSSVLGGPNPSSSPSATDTVDATVETGIGRASTTSIGTTDVALTGAGSDSGGTPSGGRAGVTSPTAAAAAASTAASIGFGMDNMTAALQAEQMRRLLAEFASPDDPYAAAMAVGGLGCPGLGTAAGGTAGAGSSSSSGGGVGGTGGTGTAGVGDVVVLDEQQRQQQLIIPQEHQLAALTYLQSMEGMTGEPRQPFTKRSVSLSVLQFAGCRDSTVYASPVQHGTEQLRVGSFCESTAFLSDVSLLGASRHRETYTFFFTSYLYVRRKWLG